jgi:GcrA cell cycle regulator
MDQSAARLTAVAPMTFHAQPVARHAFARGPPQEDRSNWVGKKRSRSKIARTAASLLCVSTKKPPGRRYSAEGKRGNSPLNPASQNASDLSIRGSTGLGTRFTVLATSLWPPERDAELLRLRAERWTYPQIGVRMGLTRGQIDHRMTLLRHAGEGNALPVRPPPHAGSPWPERDPELKDLWLWRGSEGEQHSASEIGDRMGLSKGTIMGRASRTGLPQRGQPGGGWSDGRVSKNSGGGAAALSHAHAVTKRLTALNRPLASVPPEIITVTLPALASLMPAEPEPPRPTPPLAPAPPAEPEPRPRPPIPAEAPVPVARLHSRPHGRIVECCWPIGEPGTRAFHFCDLPSEPGRPYCGDHCGRAFIRIPRGQPAPLAGTGATLGAER